MKEGSATLNMKNYSKMFCDLKMTYIKDFHKLREFIVNQEVQDILY